MRILTLLLLLVTMATTAQQQEVQPLVNITGEGKVKVTPDGVLIRVRVETEGEQAATVKRENDQSIDAVLKYLRSEGIESKHVQTQYVNLAKNYDYNTKTYSYKAYQTLTIDLKKLSSYENVMTGLLNSGINRIDGVTFTSSKMEELRQEARIKAILNAKQKAITYAEALGQSIGKAVQISEQGAPSPPQPMYKTRMASMESDSGSSETIAPGEIEITSKIAVSFVLN